MGRLEEEVRDLILERYKNLATFARKIGIPKHTLYSALSNNLSGATLTTIVPIAKALKLDLEELAQGNVVVRAPLQSSSLVPFYGSISAGAPAETSEINDTFPIPLELHQSFPRAFMLQVKGSSMNRILPNGWYALINPCNVVDTSGELYAVAVGNNTATIKHVRILSNGIELLPDSDDPTYHPILFDNADPYAEEIHVIGKVVWYCPPIENGGHRAS